jgi:GntR family transcriptional regulator/MocR family aminotransferase
VAPLSALPQLPLTIRKHGAAPLQTQIADQIRQLVAKGILGPTSRVPSTRALSEQLGVSRNTVTLAYDILITEGFLEVESSAGTIVSRHPPASFLRIATDSPERQGRDALVVPRSPVVFRGRGPRVHDPLAGHLLYDFRMGQPDPVLFPVAEWHRLIVGRIARAGPALVRYGDPGGLKELRTAVAEHLRLARGIRCEAEQVVIVGGCQQGLNLVARLLVSSGTKAVVENPCYEGAALVLASYGAELVAGRVDEEGLCVDGLPAQAALAYVTPSHQFPMGPTLSFPRRLALLDWAARTGAYIVEDDYDSDFRYEQSPLLALYALDQADSTIYLGTFSKSIGAGLRLGYVVFPPALAQAAIGAKALLDNGHPWLEQAAVAEFLASGGFERHLHRVRRRYLARRDCLLQELRRRFGRCEIDGVEGGMHAVWHLPEGAAPAPLLQRRLADDGVGVYSLAAAPVHVLEPVPSSDSILLLGYPCLSEERIRSAVERIARAMDRPSRGGEQLTRSS